MPMFWKPRRKSPPIRSLVGEGVVVLGDLQFRDGLRVDGEVRGNVLAAADSPSLLVVGEKARITGRVAAAHVIVGGELRGPVHCTELLELQPGARLVGEVRYTVLEMHPGALVEGELRPLNSVERPALKLAASNEH
jgi:cytoskeletal protein CcmA (bactofilin family)